jgi:hypothetical protein
MGGSDGGVPESPATDAAKTRHEDNFGKPLDALDGMPPEGTAERRNE